MKKIVDKIYSKPILILFLSLVLMFNTSVLAANIDATIVSNNNKVQLNKTVNSSVFFNNIGPGDSVDYTVKIKNETSQNIKVYFIEAIGNIELQKLNMITLEIYIDGNLYLNGDASETIEKYMYTMVHNEEIEVLIKIGLSRLAGNEFQKKNLNLTWKIGIVEEDTQLNIAGDITFGQTTIIPKTGEGRNTYYILCILIAVVLIYIAILLLKEEDDDEDEEDDDECSINSLDEETKSIDTNERTEDDNEENKQDT